MRPPVKGQSSGSLLTDSVNSFFARSLARSLRLSSRRRPFARRNPLQYLISISPQSPTASPPSSKPLIDSSIATVTMSNDVSPEVMQTRIQQARREAENLKDRIKRKKDDLADGTRKWQPAQELNSIAASFF